MAGKTWKAGSGEFGSNVRYSIDTKGIMTLTVDLNAEGGLSASGKSVVIASSEGNQRTPEAPGVSIGLNVYRKA